MNKEYSRRQVIQSGCGVAAASAAGIIIGRTTVAGQTNPSVITAPALTAATRNALMQPFTPQSIWNQPIGSSARYVAAQFGNTPRAYATMPYSDPMRICLTPTSPATQIKYSSAGWSGQSRCSATSSQVLATVPIPAAYVVPSSNKNECATFLAQDGHTLIQVQPLARCSTGSPATSIIRFTDQDVYGEGRGGAHGGSRLSAIGGALRLGDMRPGSQGAPHALNLTIGTGRFLYHATTEADTFRWPAYTSDSGALGTYGAQTNNQIKAMKMGVLLALPPGSTLPSTLRTTPGKQLAWTFQNYGGYVTDGTGEDDFLISTEEGQAGSFAAQFQLDWGFAFEQRYTSSASIGSGTSSTSSVSSARWTTTPPRRSAVAVPRGSHWRHRFPRPPLRPRRQRPRRRSPRPRHPRRQPPQRQRRPPVRRRWAARCHIERAVS